MQATSFEYRFRYLIHGLIYALGFAAPWHVPAWSFVRNGSALFTAANSLAKPSYLHFALYWNLLVGLMLLFAITGAGLRVWGAAYLGATTVHAGTIRANQVITDGPFGYTRNPLYLGTLCNTVMLGWLMRPEAALLTLLLIGFFQFRLIAREEPFLAAGSGPAYTSYRSLVPRLLPSLRPRVAPQGLRPDWRQGILSELFAVGCVAAVGAFGWSAGYAWEGSVFRVIQAVLISLGLSFVAIAFTPGSRPRSGSAATQGGPFSD